ncbi:MAG TPA: LacI family DNA-binding transcriptional regulator [Nocardioidaceae bacterium]|nr:LacI family DNA-binding transcriptional regulator [Nocardioidaceae bacterium]
MSRTHHAGRPPTMADVAARAGVSHQTVSRVLNDFPSIRSETRDRVLAAITELGYRRNDAARRLASARSGLLGVVASALPQFGPASILVGLETAAAQEGYRLSSVNVVDVTEVRFTAAVEQLLEQAIEALVLLVPHRPILHVAHALDLAIPVIVVEGDLTMTPLSAGVDNLQGARVATRHLLNLGHETVVHVAGPAEWLESGARAEGWRLELEASGREIPAIHWGGDWSARSGYLIGKSLAHADTTAVFAANDQMALGIMRALAEAGRRVPEDTSVVGFDDLPEAQYFTPPLTTVRQPFDELATRVMQLIQRSLAGEAEPRVELVQTSLVIRSSTAPPS